MVTVVVAVLLGVGFGLILARLALGGVLALAFSKARNYVKRVTERRRAAHLVELERRHEERRAG
jgi:hypothetical protein